MKAFQVFKKILKYTLLIFLILFVLGVGAAFLFKDKIIQLTFKELNKHLNTKIEIDKDIDLSVFKKFPEISIGLKNVRVYENLGDSTGKLAQLKSLYFSFDAIDFLQGKYVIQNIFAEGGEIRIKINKDGETNYNIFKTDTTTASESNLSLHLQKIDLTDVLLFYSSEAVNQHHEVYIKEADSKISYKESIWYIGLDGDLFVHSIGIGNYEYFKEKAIQVKSEQQYDEDKALFKIQPSSLIVEKSEFSISGFYEGKERNEIDLKLKAEKSTISTLVSLLPKNISDELNVYRSSGNVFFESTIKGFIKGKENPQITIDFGFDNTSFYHPEFNKKIQHATLKGSFTNGKHQHLRSSVLTLNNINASLDGKTIRGNFLMENFEDPFLKFNFSGGFDIKSLLNFYPVPQVSAADGMMDAKISFEGKASDMSTKEGQEKIKAEGYITIRGLNFQLKNYKTPFKNFNGAFSFGKNDLKVDSLTGRIGNSDYFVQGSFKNFIRKIFFDKEKLLIDANIKSNHLDLNEMLTLLPSENSTTPNSEEKGITNSDYILKIRCDFKTLNFRRLNARNFSGKIEYNQKVAYLKDISFNTAGGKINLYSLISLSARNRSEFNNKINLTNIHVDSVFYLFESFNQDFLVDKHLKGQFTGNVRLFFALNENNEVILPSVTGKVEATIKNGELNNFEPIKKLAELKLVDEEQLEHIKFSELKNTIYIENEKVIIPEMELQSSVSSINVIGKPSLSNIKISGSHTFDQKIDYKLTLSLKNFFRNNQRDKDEAFGAIEEDTKGNTLVFINITGTTENYNVTYDRKRTGKKIKEDLKKEKQELENIFKNKKDPEKEVETPEGEYEFFDFN
ncbi:MAG: AsmA-like C-terminal region-containing protein [Cytophagaceae bacterium]|nr:AsmA-like C-terminal region-containing protein [Cytophagaceae bacterium]